MFACTCTLISGFTQSPGSTGNGMVRLARRVLAEQDNVYVDLCSWNDDMTQQAHKLDRMFPLLPHVLAGFSYGVPSAARLADKLLGLSTKEQSVRVPFLLAVDGVWRGFRRLANPFSLLNLGIADIDVPYEVEKVVSFRQRQNKPAGHPVTWRGVRLHARWLEVPHESIDDDALVHAVLLEKLKDVVQREMRQSN